MNPATVPRQGAHNVKLLLDAVFAVQHLADEI